MPGSAFLLIGLMMALGWGLRRAGVFDEAAAEPLNRFVIWICLPALVLQHVPTLQWQPALLGLALIPWAILAVTSAAVLLLGRLAGWPRPVVGVLLLLVPLGNTSFLGYPLVAALLGPEAVRYAVVYDQFGSFLILTLFGLPVLALYSGSGRPRLGELLRRVVLFPPFLALLVALLPVEHPQALREVLALVGAALVPVVTFAVGLQLRLKPPGEQLAPLALGLVLKLAFGPLLALALAKLLALPAGPREVAVLEAAMPTMITAGALAISAGLAPRLAAAMVGYGILIGMVTLPAWAWWLTRA